MASGSLVRAVETWVQRLKSDPTYRLDPALHSRDLAALFWRRGVTLLRGLGWAWRLGACQMPFFVGRRVRILHSHLLRVGQGVTLEDDVYIDALSREGVVLGDNVSIARFSVIRMTGVITKLGRGFSIGANSNLGHYNYVGAAGGVRIGQNVLIGQRVSFHAENHVFDRTDVPIKAQGVTQQGIVVEDDSWLGSGAIILDGVTIGRGSIVAAGSVVTQDVTPYSLVGGVPARLIRSRLPQAEAPDA